MDVRTWWRPIFQRRFAGERRASAARGTDALVSHAVAQGLDRAALAKQYGGMGATLNELIIMKEDWRASARRICR